MLSFVDLFYIPVQSVFCVWSACMLWWVRWHPCCYFHHPLFIMHACFALLAPNGMVVVWRPAAMHGKHAAAVFWLCNPAELPWSLLITLHACGPCIVYNTVFRLVSCYIVTVSPLFSMGVPPFRCCGTACEVEAPKQRSSPYWSTVCTHALHSVLSERTSSSYTGSRI